MEGSNISFIKKVKPIALISSSLIAVAAVLFGQILGIMTSLAYTPIIAPAVGLGIGFLTYLIISPKSDKADSNFFPSISIALAIVLGALWGGTTIGSILFTLLFILSTNVNLLIAMIAGSALFGLVTWGFIKSDRNSLSRLLLTIFSGLLGILTLAMLGQLWGPLGLVLTVLTSTLFAGLIALEIFGSKSNSQSKALVILSNGMIGMILAVCIGFMWGPPGWIYGINIGLGLGLMAGYVNNYFNQYSEPARVLSSLYAISGTLFGVMLGVVISPAVPFIAPALVSLFFGACSMVIGVGSGIIIGNNYPEFDLKNDSLRHHIYVASLYLPAIFIGWLTGGVIGHGYFPANEILLSQAVGGSSIMVIYTTAIAAIYSIKDMFAKHWQNSNKDQLALVMPIDSKSVSLVASVKTDTDLEIDSSAHFNINSLEEAPDSNSESKSLGLALSKLTPPQSSKFSYT